MTIQFFSLLNFSNLDIASSDQTPPVGLLGELIITPLTESSILEIKSSKSGSNCLSEIVFTSKGSAPAIRTNSGNETQ